MVPNLAQCRAVSWEKNLPVETAGCGGFLSLEGGWLGGMEFI